MADELVELLKNEKLRAEVVQTLRDVYECARTLYDDPPVDFGYGLATRGTSPWEEAWLRAETQVGHNRICQVLQKCVINQASRPSRITLDDIRDGLLLLVKPTQYTSQVPDIEPTYAVFLSFVEKCLLSKKRLLTLEICRSPAVNHGGTAFVAGLWCTRSDPPPAWQGSREEWKEMRAQLMRLRDTLGRRTDSWPDECKETLARLTVPEILFGWSSANGIEVRFSRGRVVGNWQHVVADVEGHMSVTAVEALQGEMSRLLTSIVHSISLLEPCDNPFALSPGVGGPMSLDDRMFRTQELFIKACLDAFYSKPKQKDSIDTRIRNAVHLLTESDAQSNDAIGLALSVTAMEALLGRGSTEISEKLSTDIAVLLEPELDKRHGATERVRGIYNLRSDALHGKSIEGEKDMRDRARLLAAGVLRAVVTRRDLMRRSGFDPETPQKLLEELRKGRFQHGQPIGVDEPNIRKLWEGA